jgi:hypothetical protein
MSEEGFSDSFAKAWKDSASGLGGCIGGCLPWLIGITILAFVGLVILLLIAMLGTIQQR